MINNENKKSKQQLLYASKIILVITIIFGIIGILNTPNHTFSYFVEENIFFVVSKWILFISFLSQIAITLIAKKKSKNNWNNENILEKLSFNMKIIVITIIIFVIWVGINSTHVMI